MAKVASPARKSSIGGSPSRSRAFQPHAIRVAEAARAGCFGESEEQQKLRRMADEQQWKANVIDLQRVFSLAQTLFLFLEHNNEALLRVAMEIVCCPDAAKALWWDERWYNDDAKRETFRKFVKDKLAICLKNRGESVLEDEEDDDRVDRVEYDAVKARLDLVEGQCEAAERAKRVAEKQCVELQNTIGESAEKVKALEKTCDELRKQVREKEEQFQKALEEMKNKEDPNAGKLEALEQKLKIVEDQRNKAQERAKELEGRVSTMIAPDELEKAKQRLQEMEKVMKEQKAHAEKANKELQSVQKKLEASEAALKKPPKPVQEVSTKHTGPKERDPQLDVLIQQAEAERRRASEAAQNVSDLKKSLAAKEAELAEALRKAQEMESRWKQAETRAAAAEQDTLKVRNEAAKEKADMAKEIAEAHAMARKPVAAPVVEKPVPKPAPAPAPAPAPPPPVEPAKLAPPPPKKVEEEVQPKMRSPRPTIVGVSEDEHARVKDALIKSKGRNADLNRENNELKSHNADLQDKNDRMLKMLHEIKEQLARVSAIAEKKGLGKAVNEILKESKVSETLDSEEYTCFNRLYDDAKRRQEKQRRIAEERFGIVMRVNSPHTGTRPGFRPGTGGVEGVNTGATVSNDLPPAAQYGRSEYGNFAHSGYMDNTPYGMHKPASPVGNFAHGGYMDNNRYGMSTPSGRVGNVAPGQHATIGASNGQYLVGSPTPGGAMGSGDYGNILLDGSMITSSGYRHGTELPRTDLSRSVTEPAKRRLVNDGFAVEGYNPTMHAMPKEYFQFQELAHTGRTAHPFGLTASASAGALHLRSRSNSPADRTSAMAIDMVARDGSSSRSPSPVPRGPRRLIESRSAPKLHLGSDVDELPPLTHGYQAPSRGSTPSGFATSWGSGSGKSRGLASLNNVGLQHVVKGAPWRQPQRKQMDDLLLAKRGRGGGTAGGGGIAGWSLSGHAPPYNDGSPS